MTAHELTSHVEDVLTGLWTDEVRAAALENHAGDQDLFLRFAELGWFGILAPEEDDGLGLQPGALPALFKAFGKRLVTGPWAEQMLLPGLLLALQGSRPEGDTDRLKDAVEGAARVAWVDTTATTAGRGTGSDGPRLSGTTLTGAVPLVRFAAETDLLLVCAASDQGEVLLTLAADNTGVRVEPLTSADPGTSYARVTFKDVQVAPGDVRVSGAEAVEAIGVSRAWIHVLLAAELSGIAEHLLNLSVEYIKDRKQFGRPIGSFQAIQHIAAENVRRVVLIDRYVTAVAEDAEHQAADEFIDAAMALKGFVSEQARLVCEDALQMHGGVGFTQEYELQWYYKRALALEHLFGGGDELAVQVGSNQLDQFAAERKCER